MSELELLARELVATRHQSKPAMLARRAALGADLAELVLAGRLVAIDDAELELLVYALDSHAYWQLTVAALAAADALHDRLEDEQRARGLPPGIAQG